MNKEYGIVIVLILAGVAVYALLPQSSEIPPTEAIQSIEVIYVDAIPNVTSSTFIADIYNDRLYFVTDGSILVNITEHTP